MAKVISYFRNHALFLSALLVTIIILLSVLFGPLFLGEMEVSIENTEFEDNSNKEFFYLSFILDLRNNGAGGEVVIGVDVFDKETKEKIRTDRKTIQLGRRESKTVTLKVTYPRIMNIFYSEPYIIELNKK